MKRAGNVGNTRQHLRLIRVIAGTGDCANGNACESCTRRAASFRYAGMAAYGADGAPGIDPRIVFGTRPRKVVRRRLPMRALVARRIGQRESPVHALRQDDRNALGQRIHRFLTRRSRFDAAFASGRHCRGCLPGARARLRKFKIFVDCERRAALIAAVDGDVIHRLAFRAGFEVERRAALIAELRSCGIAVRTEVTACECHGVGRLCDSRH